MENLLNFFKNDILGILTIGIIGSIIGSCLFILLSKLYIKILKYAKGKKAEYIKKTVKHFFFAGFYSAHAEQSSYHQIILIGDYIIQVILNCVYIIIISIIGVGLFLLLNISYYWIVSLVLGIVLPFPIIRLKRTLRIYQFLFEVKFKENSSAK